MTSLFSYLVTAFGGIFWLIRLVIAITYTMSVDIGIEPINFEIEVALLFITLFCMIFIIKRNIIGALAYFVTYGLYFGQDLYNGIVNINNGQVGLVDTVSLVLSLIGVVIPFLTVMDILLNKERKGSTKNENTDWFYTNKDYDRKLDERADNNQYRLK